MDYKLVLSDFDGTLLRSDGTVSEETVGDIKRYTKSGGRFAICTGRMLKSIIPYANEIGLVGDIVGNQGAAIYSLDKKQYLLHGGIDWEDGEKIAAFIEDKYSHIHLYINDELYVNTYDDMTRGYEEVCRVKANVIDCKPSEYIKKNKCICEKILVFNLESENTDCYNDLESKFGDKYFISTSSPHLVEIADVRYTKGAALNFLAKRYGISKAQTIAVGDNLNDLTMIREAGLGLAVANAHEGLKAAADEVLAYSCDQNAVGMLIRKYGLKENI